jgi:hypothetical protein
MDQVAEERRLRQDLGIEERRLGLEGDGQEFFESMEPAGRVHVIERDGEEQSPEEPCDEARNTASERFRAPADHVITILNPLEEGPQVISEIGLSGGGDENQRQKGPCETAAQRFSQAEIVDRYDPLFDRSTQLIDPLDQRGDQGRSVLCARFRQKDDANPGAGKWVSLEMRRKRIVGFLARCHSSSSRAKPANAK